MPTNELSQAEADAKPTQNDAKALNADAKPSEDKVKAKTGINRAPKTKISEPSRMIKVELSSTKAQQNKNQVWQLAEQALHRLEIVIYRRLLSTSKDFNDDEYHRTYLGILEELEKVISQQIDEAELLITNSGIDIDEAMDSVVYAHPQIFSMEVRTQSGMRFARVLKTYDKLHKMLDVLYFNEIITPKDYNRLTFEYHSLVVKKGRHIYNIERQMTKLLDAGNADGEDHHDHGHDVANDVADMQDEAA